MYLLEGYTSDSSQKLLGIYNKKLNHHKFLFLSFVITTPTLNIKSPDHFAQSLYDPPPPTHTHTHNFSCCIHMPMFISTRRSTGGGFGHLESWAFVNYYWLRASEPKET
jgi:hypothetical protein